MSALPRDRALGDRYHRRVTSTVFDLVFGGGCGCVVRNSTLLDRSTGSVGSRRIDSDLLRVVLVLHKWAFKSLAAIFPGLFRPETRFTNSVDLRS